MLKYKTMMSIGLLICITGCSIMGKSVQRSITGSWTGQNAEGVRVTLNFQDDSSMSLVFDMDGNEFSLNGKYVADVTKTPATIDLLDITTPQGDMRFNGMAIAEFPGEGSMNFYCVFGEAGSLTRPSEFNRNPTVREQLYVELKRSGSD